VNSQYWALSLSVINSDAQVDFSSWQFNLSSHVLFFQPYSLSSSSVYAGVYFCGTSPSDSVTYQIQLTASQAPFCPSACSGKGVCKGYTLHVSPTAAFQPSEKPQIPSSFPLTNGALFHSQSTAYIARITLTAQAAGQSLSLHLYMSAATVRYALHSGELFSDDCYSQTKRTMDVSGAVGLSLGLKCDCQVYFSLYNAGERVEVAV